jgi:hypothetical protein
VADADESLRQDVKQELSDELVSRDGHHPHLVAAGVISPTEGHTFAIEGDEPVVGDGDTIESDKKSPKSTLFRNSPPTTSNRTVCLNSPSYPPSLINPSGNTLKVATIAASPSLDWSTGLSPVSQGCQPKPLSWVLENLSTQPPISTMGTAERLRCECPLHIVLRLVLLSLYLHGTP